MLWSIVVNFSHNSRNKARANGFSWLSKSTTIGKNVHFNGLRIYGKGRVSIGDNFHSGKNISIYTQSHNYMGEALPYDETLRLYKININDNVWLGDDVTIIGNVEIGEGAIIQVGSVVSSDIPPLGVAGGNPAKTFRQRDLKHYTCLKSRNKFH